jgi:hypothetical protein
MGKTTLKQYIGTKTVKAKHVLSELRIIKEELEQ